VPGAGWIDFDPTSGGVGRTGLVTVAVVRDPDHATPLHGTFFGSVLDPIGMDVQVRITTAGRDRTRVAPQLSKAPQVTKSQKRSNSPSLKSAEFA
jgi:transglutaminase-like putative cysteine protease